MIEAIYCAKVEQPELHINKTKPCPKIIPLTLKCTHGTNGHGNDQCTCCGVEKSIGILKALSNLEAAGEELEVVVWRDSDHQGTTNERQKT